MTFEELASQNLDFVWRSLRRFGVPAPDVDDATQQVFLIASEKLINIREGRERSFLLAVATRVASRTRRTIERREAAKLRLLQHPAPPVLDPEHVAQRMEARDLLDRVLDTMPEPVRIVFVLFELEELSVDEITELLEIPRGTVATRLRRGRVLFKKQAAILERQNREGAHG